MKKPHCFSLSVFLSVFICGYLFLSVAFIATTHCKDLLRLVHRAPARPRPSAAARDSRSARARTSRARTAPVGRDSRRAWRERGLDLPGRHAGGRYPQTPVRCWRTSMSSRANASRRADGSAASIARSSSSASRAAAREMPRRMGHGAPPFAHPQREPRRQQRRRRRIDMMISATPGRRQQVERHGWRGDRAAIRGLVRSPGRPAAGCGTRPSPGDRDRSGRRGLFGALARASEVVAHRKGPDLGVATSTR